MKLFFTAFMQVFCISVNTIMLSKGLLPGVFVFGFAISFLWCYNVSRVSVARLRQKLLYAFGAAFGSVAGLLFVNLVLQLWN